MPLTLEEIDFEMVYNKLDTSFWFRDRVTKRINVFIWTIEDILKKAYGVRIGFKLGFEAAAIVAEMLENDDS